MAPEPPAAPSPRALGFVLLVAIGLSTLTVVSPAHALKVATWNLLGYDDVPVPSTLTPRQPYYRTVMAAMDPDVIIVQELMTAGAADSFLFNVLNVVEPGQWTRGPFIITSPKPNEIVVYWKPAKVNITNIIALQEGGPRADLLCIVKPLGYLTNPGWF